MQIKLAVFALTAAISISLSGCTTTGPFVARKEIDKAQKASMLKAYERIINQYVRVNEVGYRLLLKIPASGNQKQSGVYSGLLLDDLTDVSSAYYGTTSDRGIVVVATVTGSPSQAADFQKGDLIKRLNGKKVVSADDVVIKLKKLKPGETCQIEILRNNTETIAIELLQQTVPYSMFFTIVDRPEINSVANQEVVCVTTGTVNFVESDDELAIVLAHEMAHITHHHLESLEKDPVINIINVAFGIPRTYPISIEQEADYYGLPYAHLAGYDVKKSVEFWERVAIQKPETLKAGNSNPYFSMPEKIVQLRKLVDDIDLQMKLENATVRSKDALIDVSGLADAMTEELGLQRAVARSNVFSSDSKEVIWWGKIKTVFTGKEFVAKWYDPDGNIYLEQPFKSTFLNVIDVQTSMPIKGHPPARNPGIWSVEIYHKGDLIEKRSFLLKEYSLPKPADNGGTVPNA